MMWSRILLSCLLLPIAAGESSKPHYLVVVPAEIHSQNSEKVCVLLTSLNETITLTITLQHNENISLLSETVSEPNWHQCTSFQVPLVEYGQGVVATVQVKGKGETFEFTNEKKVLLKALESGTFVQTDKPIYKPGQTVKFRIVSLDENLIPQQLKYPLVEILDPQRNRIAQWLNVEPRQGIADLSFELASEPPMGSYTIKVKRTGLPEISSSFTVEEYVLPKYEVNLQLPKVVTILDEEFKIAVCGRYTYGKPVLGAARATLCRKKGYYWYFPREHVEDICQEYSGQTDKSGCFSQVVNTGQFNMTIRRMQLSFEIDASLVEDGTGVVLNGSGRIQISQDIVKVAFEDVEGYYRTGMRFVGKIKLLHADGSVMPNEAVHLKSVYSDINIDEKLITDNNGLASFSLDTSAWTHRMSLRAIYKEVERSMDFKVLDPTYGEARHEVQPFYSQGKSYVYIQPMRAELECGREVNLKVEYSVFGEELDMKTKKVIFYHLVMARGEIVLNGQTEVVLIEREPSVTGFIHFSLPITSDLSPLARVLVYTVLPKGQVLAHSSDLRVSKCFKNKVKLHFSEPEALPGSDSSLHLQASPGSLCAIRAVDQSVLLMKPEQQLSADLVYNILPGTDKRTYPHQVDEYESGCNYGYRGISRRSYIMPPWQQNQQDIFSIFKGVGLKVFTDIQIRKPAECLVYAYNRFVLHSPPRMGALPGAPGSPGSTARFAEDNIVLASMPPLGGAPVPLVEEKVRKYFPETWLWDLVSVGSSGVTEYPITVPDTITEWKAGMFCTADVGFGLAPTVSLKAFKPFFLEPTLPYSVIRGEAFALKATVFNYLQQPLMIHIELAESADFLAVPCDKCEYTHCISADEGKTFYWNITPKSLGEVNFTIRAEALKTDQLCGNEEPVVPERGRTDTVIKPLLVEPEGAEVEMAKSSLICTEAETPVREEISLQLPGEVVEGSARAHISVIGDIMGTAMQNLDKLLAMPYGCGEQNMVLFAPNIFILQYLEKTNQLTDEIKAKAIRFLESGYQRELTYKHSDGSYSAFGDRDPEGNTWLTAFVVKSFGQAKPYIFIDDKHIQDALMWLSTHQYPSGCFQSVGKLFSSSMKGGVDDDISLSAYITAALLELQLPLNNTMLKNSLHCLEEQMKNVTNPYTLALLAYTFTLAGVEDTRQALMEELDKLAIKKDGSVHWERPKKPEEKESPFYWYRAPSAEVEMTAYVLHAILSRAKVSGEDIGAASPIVKWITKQQGPNGGFSSTQDTVVALHALSKYGGLTYSEKGEMSVSINSNQQVVKEFQVTNDNRLLLQQVVLKDVPGTYNAEVTGKGCLFFQTTLKYNIPPPKDKDTFSIEAHTIPKECTDESRITFDIQITVSYTGKRDISNMAIVEVKMLSGFIPVKKSVKQLEKNALVKRTEIQTALVTIYLDELTHAPMTYIFSVEQELLVQNLKPAVVRVYDYYETDEQAVTQYNAPCSTAKVKEGNTR